MNRPTFDQTVNVLVQAYLNDTLEHHKCSACAVGNIIRASGVILSKEGESDVQWLRYISKYIRKNLWAEVDLDEKTALHQIQSTGYSAEELSRIETAFEEYNCLINKDEAMFNGLMAVVEVLAEIHEVPLEQKEKAKLLFQ